jgi:uncharacterized protein YkwD
VEVTVPPVRFGANAPLHPANGPFGSLKDRGPAADGALMAVSVSLRRTLVAALLAATVTAGVLLPAGTAAAGTPSQDEYSFLQKLNQARRSAGLAPVVSDPELAPTSRTWSQHMASRNVLSHDPNLVAIVSQIEPAWRSVAENVGYGYSVQSLHDAFMASAGHRANILRSSYNRVGIGVVHSGGRIWVTVRFLQGPAISGETGLEPAGVRTVLTGDFDGDGREDMLTYNPGTTADELWFGRPDREMDRASVSVNGQYRPVAGDFDGDGLTQILWYAPGSSTDYLWEWNGSGWSSSTRTVNGTYRALAGDFDGDGRDDLLWYAAGGAGDYYWYGNSNGSFSSIATEINGTYAPLIGDLDGNGGDDLFWYAKGTAKDFVWYSTLRRGGYSSRATTVNGTYTPFTGDFDGRGTDDIFWYAPGGTNDFIWFTNRTRGEYSSVARTVNNSYLPGAADFDGNGADDVVWFSPSTAAGDLIWFGTPASTSYSSSTVRSS